VRSYSDTSLSCFAQVDQRNHDSKAWLDSQKSGKAHVKVLPTRQGRRGEDTPGFFQDATINGCSVIVMLLLIIFLSGEMQAERIPFVIDTLSSPILNYLRSKYSPGLGYVLLGFVEVRSALVLLGLIKVRVKCRLKGMGGEWGLRTPPDCSRQS